MSDSDYDTLSEEDFTPRGAYKKTLYKRQKACQVDTHASVKEAAEEIADILEELDQEQVQEALNMALSWLGLVLEPATVTGQKKK